VTNNWAVDRVFTPSMGEGDREKLYKGWKRAVDRARDWAKDE
jgi:glycerol kinase